MRSIPPSSRSPAFRGKCARSLRRSRHDGYCRRRIADPDGKRRPVRGAAIPPPAGDALAYIELYNGPPENPPDLASDDTKMTGGMTSNFWHLRAGPQGLSINAATAEGPYSRMETIRLRDMVKTRRVDFEPGRKVNGLTLQKFFCR